MVRMLAPTSRPLLIAAGLALALVAVLAGAWQLGQRRLAVPPSALVASADGMRVALQVGPLVDGRRAIEAWVSDERGRPAELQSVGLRFTMPFICADIIDVVLVPVGAGHFRASGAFFGMAGSWQADITLQSSGASSRQARLFVPVERPDVVAPFGAGRPPDPAFLAAGRRLYAANCASCHGAGGAGDGPRGLGLTPRPTNLVEHMVAGKHTDEQTFLTISAGRPGTAMPAWGDKLSPDEIWQLAAYIRTFARPSATPAQSELRP